MLDWEKRGHVFVPQVHRPALCARYVCTRRDDRVQYIPDSSGKLREVIADYSTYKTCGMPREAHA